MDAVLLHPIQDTGETTRHNRKEKNGETDAMRVEQKSGLRDE
jgi:hypothetical protein